MASVTVPIRRLQSYYENWDGYVPGNPSTDTGGIELDVLNDWQKQGFAGHALMAFADPKDSATWSRFGNPLRCLAASTSGWLCP